MLKRLFCYLQINREQVFAAACWQTLFPADRHTLTQHVNTQREDQLPVRDNSVGSPGSKRKGNVRLIAINSS